MGRGAFYGFLLEKSRLRRFFPTLAAFTAAKSVVFAACGGGRKETGVDSAVAGQLLRRARCGWAA
jgi:hypothetical protein